MTTIKPALTPSTDLLNVKREGFGVEMLDAKPGRFVVLKECSYAEAEEFRAYVHDGSARRRARASCYAHCANRFYAVRTLSTR